jgi:oxygen-dependent protoporphyrinogen oxidase
MPRADTSHRYVISKGSLTELPMKIGPLLASDVWSTRGKLRMMFEPFVSRRSSGTETVSQFITRRLGREVLDKTMGPYVAGLLASDPDKADARSVLPRLVALEKRYGSIAMGVFVHRVLKKKTAMATEAFSFPGGMSTLTTSLANGRGVCFRGGHPVTRLSRAAGGWEIVAITEAGERVITAKHVVLSTPANIAASLVSRLDRELSDLLNGIEYARLAVVHTGFKRNVVTHALDGNGFLTQGENGSSLIGCMWMSSLFSDRAPPGYVLLSNYLGGARYPDVTARSKQHLLAETMKSLRPLLGIHGDPAFVHIVRHRQGLPLYHGDYFNRMKKLERLLAPLPGMHVEANFRGGISVRDRLVCAMHVAEKIRQSVMSSSPIYSLPKSSATLGALAKPTAKA